MKEYLEVSGHPGLVRDPDNNAILSVDFEKIERARRLKKEKLTQEQIQRTFDSRLSSLESDISEIKEVLNSIAKNLYK
jgi:hypothetical protein